ncbi:MAG: hypothetical protein D6675_15050 [Gemmatimonadetes bacterium]|nr:MAG: hypothetical protein D6675_15050 [Gemmatimonadota bacterium]
MNGMISRTLMIGLTLFMAVFACSQQSVSNDGATVVVKIGDDVITLEQLEARLQDVPSFAQKNYQGEMGKLRMLNQMIDEKLVVLDAKAKKLDQLPRVQARLEQIREQMMKQELFNDEITSKVNVTDEDVKAYYKAHIDYFTQPEKVKVRHILVNSETDAQAVLARLRKGESFEDLAEELSQDPKTAKRGGLIGLITKGQEIRFVGKSEAFENAAFSLEAGEVSDQIIQTDKGYHIIKVDERIAESTQPVDEVREQVEAAVRREKMTELRDALMTQLKADYQIKVYEENIPETVDFNSPITDEQNVLLADLGDETIHLKDLQQMMESAPPAIRSRYNNKDGVLFLVEQKINDMLIYRAAVDRGYADNPVVQEQIERSTNALLVETHYTEEIEGKLTFSDEQLREYYDDHISEFTKPERVQAYHILLETAEDAQKIKKMLDDGADFQETAKTYSKDVRSAEKGGALGLVQKGRFIPSVGQSPDFEAAIFNLKPGEISDIIETSNGFHIAMIDEKLPEEVEPFTDEVKDRIRRILTPAESRRFKAKRMKELRKEYGVVVYEDKLIDPEKKIEWLFNEAQEAQADNRPDEALDNYDEIIEMMPASEHAYKAQFMKGFVQSEFLKDYDQAIREYEKVLTYEEGELHDDAAFMIEDLKRRKQGGGTMDLVIPKTGE